MSGGSAQQWACYLISIRTSTQPELLEPRRFIDPGRIPGASKAFRRLALEAIGGFDDNLGAGMRVCFEDGDAQASRQLRGLVRTL